MDLDLTARRAVVTGGSRGIGHAIADRLLREGAHVAICARGRGGVDAALADWRARGFTVHGEALDVRVDSAVEGFAARAAQALGGIDILVSNISTRLDPAAPTWWADSFASDFHQHVRLFDAALPHLAKGRDPAVVFIASIAAVMTSLPPHEIAYGAMKAALVSFAGQMAAVHGRSGMRVNTVMPGPVDFPGGFWDGVRAANPDHFKAAARLAALGRHGTPAEIADAVAFLASPRAGFVSGACLRIDGGALKTVNF